MRVVFAGLRTASSVERTVGKRLGGSRFRRERVRSLRRRAYGNVSVTRPRCRAPLDRRVLEADSNSESQLVVGCIRGPSGEPESESLCEPSS